MFCTVTAVRVPLLCCDSGACTCFLERVVREKKVLNTTIPKSLNRPLPHQCDMILSQPVQLLQTFANQTYSAWRRCIAINMSRSFPGNSSKPRFICSCAVYRQSLPFPCTVFVCLSNALYISCLSIALECRQYTACPYVTSSGQFSDANCTVKLHQWNCFLPVIRTKLRKNLYAQAVSSRKLLLCRLYNLHSLVHRVLVGKPEGTRPLGRPRRRWEDNI
jgi:hypothetical protein